MCKTNTYLINLTLKFWTENLNLWNLYCLIWNNTVWKLNSLRWNGMFNIDKFHCTFRILWIRLRIMLFARLVRCSIDEMITACTHYMVYSLYCTLVNSCVQSCFYVQRAASLPLWPAVIILLAVSGLFTVLGAPCGLLISDELMSDDWWADAWWMTVWRVCTNSSPLTCTRVSIFYSCSIGGLAAVIWTDFAQVSCYPALIKHFRSLFFLVSLQVSAHRRSLCWWARQYCLLSVCQSHSIESRYQ